MRGISLSPELIGSPWSGRVKKQADPHDSSLYDVGQLAPDSCFLATLWLWVRVQALSQALDIDLTIDPLGWSWP